LLKPFGFYVNKPLFIRLFYSLKSGLKGIPFYPDVTINRYAGGQFFDPQILTFSVYFLKLASFGEQQEYMDAGIQGFKNVELGLLCKIQECKDTRIPGYKNVELGSFGGKASSCRLPASCKLALFCKILFFATEG
jgi:hypothetical protein